MPEERHPDHPPCTPADAHLRTKSRTWMAAVADIVRGALGVDAYAAYRTHHALHHPGRPPMTEREFFRHEVQRRWSGVQRCC